MKKSTLLLLAAILVLSGCSVFDLQSRAKHSYLNKVPANETTSVATQSESEQTTVINDTVVNEIFSEPEVLISENETCQKSAEKTVSKRKVNPLRSMDVIRDFNKTFRAQANAQSAKDHQNIDPVTLLIWVIVIAVILVLLGYLLPVLWNVVIIVLLLLLLFMAISFVAMNI